MEKPSFELEFISLEQDKHREHDNVLETYTQRTAYTCMPATKIMQYALFKELVDGHVHCTWIFLVEILLSIIFCKSSTYLAIMQLFLPKMFCFINFFVTIQTTIYNMQKLSLGSMPNQPTLVILITLFINNNFFRLES